MKYILFVFTFLFGLQAHAGPIVVLSPSANTLGFNQAFTVDVFVSGIEVADSLIAFGFDLDFDPGLTYSGATVAAPFLDDSASFSNTDVAASTFPGIFGDDIFLGTLSFMTGMTSGVLDFSIVTTPADFGFSEGLFTAGNTFDVNAAGAIEVVQAAAVPLPSTLLLLGLGLCGIVVRRSLAN